MELEPLGLAPDVVTRLFVKAAIPLQYAELNPHVHVVLMFYREDNFYFVNSYCPGADGFFLANGNADPAITAVMSRIGRVK